MFWFLTLNNNISYAKCCLLYRLFLLVLSSSFLCRSVVFFGFFDYLWGIVFPFTLRFLLRWRRFYRLAMVPVFLSLRQPFQLHTLFLPLPLLHRPLARPARTPVPRAVLRKLRARPLSDLAPQLLQLFVPRVVPPFGARSVGRVLFDAHELVELGIGGHQNFGRR